MDRQLARSVSRPTHINFNSEFLALNFSKAIIPVYSKIMKKVSA